MRNEPDWGMVFVFLGALLAIGFWCSVVYVAIHFIAKFW